MLKSPDFRKKTGASVGLYGHKNRGTCLLTHPTGDQPEAIAKLVEGLNRGDQEQTLLGVTGSGKTFTMANIIAQVQRPTLILAHNKTLAAQLCSEFREFFLNSAVEYFVSYYTSPVDRGFFNAV